MSSAEPRPLKTEREKRQRQLLALGRLLLEQARAGQWDAVRLTDARLARFANQMQQHPALWSALLPVREQVRQWHGEAYQLCQQETARRKQEWQDLVLRREGLSAYDEVQLRWG